MIRANFFAIVLLLIASSVASAEFVTWDFQGVYNGSTPHFGVLPGQSTVGHFTFFVPSPNATLFGFSNSSVRLDSDRLPTIAIESNPVQFGLTVNNGTNPNLHDELFFGSTYGFSPYLGCGDRVQGNLRGGAFTLWNSLIPPTTPPSLAWFNPRELIVPINVFASQQCVLVDFELTSLTRRSVAYEYIVGDFNLNGVLEVDDLAYLKTGIYRNLFYGFMDLNHDGSLTPADVMTWITDVYHTLPGDANLDFHVDGSDFGIWNSHKFTFDGSAWWGDGDFDSNGVVDGSDFGIWNANKFTSADGSLVPEPSFVGILLLVVGMNLRCWRRLAPSTQTGGPIQLAS